MVEISTPITTVKTMTGDELARRIRRASAVQRALIAADLEAERLKLQRPTRRQSQLIAGASYSYVGQAARLSEHDRERLRNGFATLAELQGDISERTLESFVKRAGVLRVVAAAKRMARLAVAAE